MLLQRLNGSIDLAGPSTCPQLTAPLEPPCFRLPRRLLPVAVAVLPLLVLSAAVLPLRWPSHMDIRVLSKHSVSGPHASLTSIFLKNIAQRSTARSMQSLRLSMVWYC